MRSAPRQTPRRPSLRLALRFRQWGKGAWQGRLRAARAELAAADARSRATLLELDQRLHDAYLTLTAALARAKAFKEGVLPRANTVLKAAEARFAAGDASLADVLPVRREWALAHVGHLESLRDVMQAWTALTVLVDVK